MDCVASETCGLSAPLRYDGNFDVTRQPYHALERASAQALMPPLCKAPAHENLCGVMVARKLYDALRDVIGGNHFCPDAQIAREAKMFLDRLALFLREISERGIRADIHRQTLGAQVVGHP